MRKLLKRIVTYLFSLFTQDEQIIKTMLYLYPEIVFWEVGHVVEVSFSYSEENTNPVSFVGAVITDISENGMISFRFLAYHCYVGNIYNTKGIRDKLPCDLKNIRLTYEDQTGVQNVQFKKRLMPTTIEVYGCIRHYSQEIYALKIYNSFVQNKDNYHELRKAIRELTVGNEAEWQELEAEWQELESK